MTLRQEEGPLCLKSWKSRSSIAWGHGRNVFFSFVSFKQQRILSFLGNFLHWHPGWETLCHWRDSWTQLIERDRLWKCFSRGASQRNKALSTKQCHAWKLSGSFFRSLYSLIRVFREAIRNIKNIQKLFVSVLVLNFHFGVARCKLESLNWHLSTWNPSSLTTTAVFGIELQLQSCLTCTIHNRVGQSWKRSWRARSRFPAHEPLCWVPRKPMGPRLNIQRTYLYTCTVCYNYLCAFMINM